MWLRTPENVCSSSYAARCVWAGSAAAMPAENNAPTSMGRRARLVERGEMLLGNADLAFIATRRESGELRERGACSIGLAQLLKHEPQVKLWAGITGVRGDGLSQNRRCGIHLSRVREGLSEGQQQQCVVGIGIHCVATRRDC